jgi:fermentation-respiration switch protein FrsA (DUF1100 family)
LIAAWLAFARAGYGVILYDLRRHGGSPAEFGTAGYQERKDVIAAANFARARAPQNRLVLMGVSMGAAATLMAAAELNDVMAIVAESSFLSFRDTITHHVKLMKLPAFPFAPLLANITAWRMNFAVADFDVQAAVARINRPILFIGGGADRRMPTEQVLEPLYASASSPLKTKFIVPDAQHGRVFSTAPAAYQQQVEDFLNAVERADKTLH